MAADGSRWLLMAPDGRYATTKDALRGTGELEERDQLPGQAKRSSTAAAAAEKFDPATSERGDLIAKVPLTMPTRRAPQRLRLVPNVFHLPPVALLTTTLSAAVPPASAGRSPSDLRVRLVPAAPLAALILHTVLPAVLSLIAQRRRAAGGSAAVSAAVSAASSSASSAASSAAELQAAAPTAAGKLGAEEELAALDAPPSSRVASGIPDGDAHDGAEAAAPAEAAPALVAVLAGPSVDAAASPTGEAAAGEAAASGLSLVEIHVLRDEAFADDVEMLDEMVHWSKEEAVAYFDRCDCHWIRSYRDCLLMTS